jgi:hypothetical protein
MPSIVLLDGFTNGTWKITRHRGTATLTIRPFKRLLDEDATALAEEGARLLAFVAPDADMGMSGSPPPTRSTKPKGDHDHD